MTTLNQLLSISFMLIIVSATAAQSTFEFKSVKVPETDAEKRAILVAKEVRIADKSYPIDFHTLLRSGNSVGKGIFGLLVDAKGNPLKSAEGQPEISNKNDFSSLIPIGKKLFMISHFEDLPGALYLTELKQDLTNGQLTAINTQFMDVSEIHGIWLPCAGSVTAWNTHLGSEEYEPDARTLNLTTREVTHFGYMARYYGGNLLALNPYDYGFVIEVQLLNEQSDYSVKKHYAMGRRSLELAYVMPDNKTVYLTDDGSNNGLYLFLADKPADLSAGTLYAMKWQQTGAQQGGQANLEWIKLGQATDQQIQSYLAQKITFNAIFDTQIPTANQACPESFQSINTTVGQECLKVKPNMATAAAHLETRRYAAMMGATTELRKLEGMTLDSATNTLYVAITEIALGMENHQKQGQSNDQYDQGGANHIQLPFNRCGGIYALNLVTDNEIGSHYVAKNIKGLVMGKMIQANEKASTKPTADHNQCDLESIANPDNITAISGYNTLIIGEDTKEGHQNDMVWAYNLTTHHLTRIQTTPYGSETTSIYFYPNLNGFGYLMSVIPHPYGETDQDKLRQPDEAKAYTGYIGPFPAIK
ncbi:hypothetical protein THII_0504 [Thioploca ingrica]|uniref:Alkaline phosphatase n=1 Tax=Thioploca ingrica TaxID=40754 RepID=A0A090BUB2_9GAMM|nr:hypothetical protein THII_0504 [Thioploca ingrica]